MATLRKPFFFASIALITLAFIIEIGAPFVLPNIADQQGGNIEALVDQMLTDETIKKQYSDRLDLKADVTTFQTQNDEPPGLGIAFLALLDGLIIFTLLLIASPMFFSAKVHARIQGVSSLIASLVVIFSGIAMLFMAIGLLMIMISLFTAAPFGTIAYMAVYGFFDQSSAGITLGLLMTLKIAFAICLVASHTRFLENKSLIFIVLSSLVTTIIVSFLHGLVPGFLVSITDAIAAIVVAIIAIVWAIFFLFGSIPSIIKAIG